MSEGTNNEPQKMSRRDFLKKIGLIGAGSVATVALAGCKEGSNERSSFREVGDNEKIPLNISGEDSAVDVNIQYNSEPDGLQFSPLEVRQEGGDGDVVKPFRKGEETTRMLGEIIDPTIYKVLAKSEKLGNEITVGVYPTVNGNINSGTGRMDISELGDVYGIKVIVNGAATRNYGIDDPPLETNENAKYDKVKEFGKGLAIGKFENDTFRVMGYVCDSRAVELQ